MPWELAYREEYRNLSEAKQRELQIKSWKKRVAIDKLVNISKFNRGSSVEFGGPLA